MILAKIKIKQESDLLELTNIYKKIGVNYSYIHRPTIIVDEELFESMRSNAPSTQHCKEYDIEWYGYNFHVIKR